MAMTKTCELEIMSREVIKPSSPTPAHLRNFKFSVIDQLVSPLYVPMILLYKKANDHVIQSPPSQIIRQLKDSLSKTLTRYYPFAGRVLDDGTVITCNDAGVEFVEARISAVLGEATGETLNKLFASDFYWRDTCKNVCLIAVQVTFFDCGGITVSACTSHKIADGCSTSTFLSDWAAMTRHSGEEHLVPQPTLVSTLLVDLHPSLNDVGTPEMSIEQKKSCVTARFTFSASMISKLKATTTVATSAEQLVTAFLYKCATAVAATANAERRKEICVMMQMLDMRGRVEPPFSRNAVGNFSWFFSISTQNRMVCEGEEGFDLISLDELVSMMSNEKKKVLNLGDMKNNMNASGPKVQDWLSYVGESTKQVKVLFDNIEAYRFTCITGKSFTWYETDFGWGKPVLMRMADGVVTNCFILFDTPDGKGIDAWVTLDERDMPLFQRQHDHQLSLLGARCKL